MNWFKPYYKNNENINNENWFFKFIDYLNPFKFFTSKKDSQNNENKEKEIEDTNINKNEEINNNTNEQKNNKNEETNNKNEEFTIIYHNESEKVVYNVNFDEAFSSLAKINYKGWLTIEAFSRNDPDFANAIGVWREYSEPWDIAE